MKVYYLTLLVLPIFASKICIPSNSNHVRQECDASEYKEYVTCVTRRQKREACCDQDDCSSSCDDCNCQQCSQSSCSDNCNSCCGNFEHTCQTHYCCYKTCHAQCETSDCRRSCRKSCKETVDKITGSFSHEGSHNSTAHIKTVLNVYNEINNTNTINIPVDVNTTSYNNITVLTSQTGSLDQESYYSPRYDIPMPYYPQPALQEQPRQLPQVMPQRIETPCCTVATPQQCFPQPRPPYVGCYYQTQQVCNSVCQSHPVIHPYTQRVCNDGIMSPCQSQVVYSPQPRPTCATAPRWPYFGCGTPQFECSGCYDQQVDVSQCPDYCNGGYYR